MSRLLTWHFRTRYYWHGGPHQKAAAGCRLAGSGTTSRSPRTRPHPRGHSGACASRGPQPLSSGGSHLGPDDLREKFMTFESPTICHLFGGIRGLLEPIHPQSTSWSRKTKSTNLKKRTSVPTHQQRLPVLNVHSSLGRWGRAKESWNRDAPHDAHP